MSASLAALAILAARTPLVHQDSPAKPVALSEKEVSRPSARPDRIVLTWSADPATSQSVTWRTDTSVAASMAEVAVETDGPTFNKTPGSVTVVKAETEKLVTDLNEAHFHSVTFGGLKPKTKYVYRVGDGANWSEWIQFTTASAKAEPFSFIYFGDAQNDVRSMWSRVIRQAFSDAPKAKFTLHAGDLINRANRDAEWHEWHGAGGWMNAMMPVIATPGNHEYERVPDTEQRLISRHWRPQFTYPTNGLKGLEESNYYIDYQGVRFISLDSNVRLDEQAKWLDQNLSGKKPRWVIVTFHHPVFSAAKSRDNAKLRELWKPVFDKHRVDLVLQGHDHTYARGFYTNVPEGSKAMAKSGTAYVVSVSGPKMYDLEREPWMARAAEDTQLYQIIHVESNKIRYEARTVKGTLYDAFDLLKQGKAPNLLVEKKPKTPENLRPKKAPAGG
jgi:3',5'-cyclic AMP phosphodiesterase CpdA